MGLFNFGFGSLEKHQREKNSSSVKASVDKEDKGKKGKEEKKIALTMNRREFLKTAAVAAGSAMIGSTGIVKVAEFFSNLEDKEEEETLEQKKIAEEDIKSLKDILDYKRDKIELDLKTAEQVKNHWRERYTNSPLKDDFARAFYKMGSWQKDLERIFQEEGVDKKYIYLAIPESHWQIEAVSHAQAVGPYQFIKETAARYDLKMDWRVDERKDPLKSGRAAARLLKHLYKITGDWNLALSGYNGGYLKGYIEQTKERNKTMSYEGFLKYMQDKINDLKEEIRNKNSYIYKTKEAIRLIELAEILNVKVNNLCQLNKKSKWAKLKAGQELGVPLDEKGREELFYKKIRGFTENLNYPQKFDAIYELISGGFVQEQGPVVKFSEVEIHQEKDKLINYQVKRGDGLNKISRHLGVSVEAIKRKNLSILRNGLQNGEVLKIPVNKVKPITLEILAQKKGINIAKLKFLNPAIKSGAPIPDGYLIRVSS